MFAFSSIVLIGQKNHFTDLKYHSLQGNVKTLETEVFTRIEVEDSIMLYKINHTEFERNEILEFSQSGKLTKLKEYYSNGRLNKHIEYFYNRKNQLVCINERNLSGKETFTSKEYTYKNDSLIQVKLYSAAGEYIEAINRNQDGLKTSFSAYLNDSMLFRQTFKYNKKDQLIKHVFLNPENLQPIKSIYKKYESNRLIQDSIIEPTNWISPYYNFYSYSEDGNTKYIKSNYIDENNYDSFIEKYNEKSVLTYQKVRPVGAEYYRVNTMKWDAQGNMIYRSSLDSETNEKQEWFWNYLFDQQNNWVIKEIGDIVIKRKITYY